MQTTVSTRTGFDIPCPKHDIKLLAQYNSTKLTMQIYQPFINSTDRVVWHGGESIQLHYEKLYNTYDLCTNSSTKEWLERDVQTLGSLPTSMKDMLAAMQEYYDCSQELEQERIRQLMWGIS